MPVDDAPAARALFLLFAAGVAALALAFVAYGIDQGGYSGFRDVRWLFQMTSRWFGKLAWFGVIATPVGYAGAFHYHHTLGRVLRWVRTGRR